MNKELWLINLTVGKKHFKKWMKWLIDVHGFEFQDVAPFNQYLCIDVEVKAVWFCMLHRGILDVSEPYELYELMFDHFRVQSDLKILSQIKHDKVNVEQIADRDYVNSQIRNTSPADQELAKFHFHDNWYRLDIEKTCYFDCITHLIHCGFKDVSVPPFSTPPSETASYAPVRLNISIARKEFKLHYGFTMGVTTKEISSVTQLSNWLNVMINHRIFSRF